jgi:hypothetical protein
LIVQVSDALDNVEMQSLVLAPNPLKANQILYIFNEFTVEERNGLVVELFDILGQCVYAVEPDTYPIAINHLNQTGIYLVRITTGMGTVYQGKILFE